MDPQPYAHDNAGHKQKPTYEEAMPLRDILVHLDFSPRTAERLALALHLAKPGNARLAGVFAQRASAYQVGVVAVWPPESYTQAANASRGSSSRPLLQGSGMRGGSTSTGAATTKSYII